MELRFPILFLVLIVLAWCCIAGCTGTGSSYCSTPKPAMPVITPEVSPPPIPPAGIPSSVTSGPEVPVSASLYRAQIVTFNAK